MNMLFCRAGKIFPSGGREGIRFFARLRFLNIIFPSVLFLNLLYLAGWSGTCSQKSDCCFEVGYIPLRRLFYPRRAGFQSLDFRVLILFCPCLDKLNTRSLSRLRERRSYKDVSYCLSNSRKLQLFFVASIS